VGGDEAAIDGLSTCKLIIAIQTCASIRGIVFVHTGSRFPENLKIWYDRLREITYSAPTLTIFLLENQVKDLNPGITEANHKVL